MASYNIYIQNLTHFVLEQPKLVLDQQSQTYSRTSNLVQLFNCLGIVCL